MSSDNFSQQDPFGIPPQTGAPYSQPSNGKSSTTTIIVILASACVLMLMCGGVLLALLLPAVSAARSAAQRQSRSNNVKMVGLGMHNYHSAYNQLPYTVTQNAAGEERLGWRVALSPFVEGQSQWERFDQEQPWNSPNNEPLSVDPPFTFQALGGELGDTNIFVIEDPRGMFPPTPNTRVAFRDITDGLSNTIMAVELPNQFAIWSSNDNLTADQAYAAITSLEPPTVAHLLMGDGAVRAVSSSISRTDFDAMVTKDGGEAIASPF